MTVNTPGSSPCSFTTGGHLTTTPWKRVHCLELTSLPILHGRSSWNSGDGELPPTRSWPSRPCPPSRRHDDCRQSPQTPVTISSMSTLNAQGCRRAGYRRPGALGHLYINRQLRINRLDLPVTDRELTAKTPVGALAELTRKVDVGANWCTDWPTVCCYVDDEHTSRCVPHFLESLWRGCVLAHDWGSIYICYIPTVHRSLFFTLSSSNSLNCLVAWLPLRAHDPNNNHSQPLTTTNPQQPLTTSFFQADTIWLRRSLEQHGFSQLHGSIAGAARQRPRKSSRTYTKPWKSSVSIWTNSLRGCIMCLQSSVSIRMTGFKKWMISSQSSMSNSQATDSWNEIAPILAIGFLVTTSRSTWSSSWRSFLVFLPWWIHLNWKRGLFCFIRPLFGTTANPWLRAYPCKRRRQLLELSNSSSFCGRR